MIRSASVSSRPNRPSVAPREWLVAVSGGLTLAFSAWGLGGIPLWSLHVLLAGGLLTLLFALCPFPKKLNAEHATSHSSLQSLKRLVRWPFFWLSFAFIIYLLIGALNPAAQVVSDERGWWVEAIKPRLALWLPISVVSDYQRMDAWRVFNLHFGACALAWGLWAGLSRRAPVLCVLWCLLASGAAMGLVGVLQKLSGADAVLWQFPSSNKYFWGSFFYRNQGTAYLNLVLTLSGFLFFYHGIKARQKVRTGGPHYLCFLLYVMTAASVGLALSRGGILFGALLTIVAMILLVVYLLQGFLYLRSLWSVLITLLLLCSGSLLFVRYLDLDAIQARFGDVGATIENANQDMRAVASRATWEMSQDRPLLGWGAGSFRYIFPMYQRNYPEIYLSDWFKYQGKPGRQSFRYAHNDILQFIAEYGWIGAGLIFAALASLVVQAFWSSGSHSFAALILAAGLLQAFGHAFIDFTFNSPAYWFALLGLLVATTQLLHLEVIRSYARSG